MTTYNTGNPIGSTDPRDLYDNAENFDNAVNDRTATTWTDRLGVARKTVFGAFQDITYKTPESYTVGLSFLTTDANKTVEEAGVVYAPLNSALPFTTSGTFSGDDDARFYPVQDKNNVIRVTSIAEIESLVGVADYQVSLSGSRAQTFAFSTANLSAEVTSDAAQGKYIAPSSDATGASGAWVSLQSTVLARHFGVTPSSADNSASWQALLNFKPGHVHFDEVGTYTFLSSSDHDTSISVTAVPGAVFDCTAVGFTGNHWTKFTGAFPVIENLGTPAVKGARTVSFLSAPSLSAGDVFVIWNPAASSWSGFRSAYNAGEFCRVVSISGNDVVIAGELYDDYAYGATSVFRLDSIQVNLDNLDIRGNTSFGLLDLEFCRDSVLNNIKAFHKNNSILTLQRCFNVSVMNPAMHNEGDGGDDYGIALTNSQNIKVIGGDIYSRRHAITTGGDIDPGNVPCRNLKFIGITLSNDINSGTHCADFHGNTEDSSYENCEIYGGATWQGKNNGYINCIIGSIAVGVCILASEIKGGHHYARGCSLHTITDPQLSFRGIVDVGGNTLPVREFTVEPCAFEITGCKVQGRNFGTPTSIMVMRNRGASVDINIVIDDLELDVDNLGQILLTDLASGTASSEFIVVDNIKSHGGITGKFLVLHSGNSYRDFPHKLQKQSGAQTVTSSTSSSTVSASAVTFNWVYPRTPVTIVGRNNRGYLGSRIGVPYSTSLSSTGLTANLSTDDATNFSSATTVELHWRAGIDEL